MNKDEMKGDWEQFKGKAKQKWSMLGDKDFDLYQQGKRQEFAGKIQETYGKSKEAAEKELASRARLWETVLHESAKTTDNPETKNRLVRVLAALEKGLTKDELRASRLIRAAEMDVRCLPTHRMEQLFFVAPEFDLICFQHGIGLPETRVANIGDMA